MQSKCNSFNYDYHSVEIGDLCISFSWNYVGQSCTPVTFILQGFEPEDVRDNQLNAPILSVNSTSATFSLVRSLAVHENLYYRVIGMDDSGTTCVANSLTGYLNYSIILETGLPFSNTDL